MEPLSTDQSRRLSSPTWSIRLRQLERVGRILSVRVTDQQASKGRRGRKMARSTSPDARRGPQTAQAHKPSRISATRGTPSRGSCGEAPDKPMRSSLEDDIANRFRSVLHVGVELISGSMKGDNAVSPSDLMTKGPSSANGPEWTMTRGYLRQRLSQAKKTERRGPGRS